MHSFLGVSVVHDVFFKTECRYANLWWFYAICISGNTDSVFRSFKLLTL